jgi:putative flippase GtrA
VKARTIAFRYAVFAAAATLVNLATQALSLAIYDGRYGLYVAMAFGTVTGLAVKYILDKRYIFYFRPTNLRQDLGIFVLYSAMSVITTLIFWGTELLFERMFDFDGAMYVGAAIGLTIGYTTKYFLSKHFVFIRRNRGDARPAG